MMAQKIQKIMVLVIMSLRLSQCRDPVLHRVGGGKYTWSPNFNYSDWSSGETFYAGDWLYFGYDKHLYSVFEVNETSYKECIDRDFIKNITQGGRDVFQIIQPKPYFFISGGGFCFQGMKLAVYVRKFPTNATTNQSSIRVSSDGSQPSILVLFFVVATLAFSFMLMF